MYILTKVLGDYLLADIGLPVKPAQTGGVDILNVTDRHGRGGGAAHLMHHLGDRTVSDEKLKLLGEICLHSVLDWLAASSDFGCHTS